MTDSPRDDKVVSFGDGNTPRQPQDWVQDRESLEAQVTALRKAVSDLKWVVIIAAIVVALAVSGISVTMVRRHVDELMVYVSQQEKDRRISRIIGALEDVPKSYAQRLKTGPRQGAPHVRVLQQLLPELGRISARERDLACELAPHHLCRMPD